MRRLAPFMLVAAVLAACQDTPEPLAPEPNAPSRSAAAGETVAGQYIIVFRTDVSDAPGLARQLTAAHGGGLQFVYQHALKGFSAQLSAQAAAALQRHPSVAHVEQDQVVYAFGEIPTGVARIFAPGNAELDIDGSDDYRVDVDVAIIDTGIDLDHPDLNVNVAGSVNCSGGSPLKGSCTSGGDDDNNHGTHVAGTVAALDNGSGVVGVAPGARLWAVKVLRADGSGYMSWIVAGIEYVTLKASEIEVANMSLGCECSSDAMDEAITNSVAAGVTYVVAAGNSDKDASTFSPANHPDVITVSALADFDGKADGTGSSTCRTDQDDTLADFSNFGSTVEITAPGVCILSTVPGGYATYSGTSMASPHAAGAAALLAASASYSPSQIRSTLIAEGNTGWTDDSGDGIQEPLLDVSDAKVFNPVLIPGSGGGSTNTTPTAQITSPSGTISGTVTVQIAASDSEDAPGSLTVSWSLDGGPARSTTYNSTTGYYEASWTTTEVGDGSHTINARATDSGGLFADAATVTVTVDNVADGGGSSTTMHVGDLDNTSANQGSTWQPAVTIEVHDGNDSAISGITVTGEWSGTTASGNTSCVTDTSGRCTLFGNSVPKKTGSVSFTVSSVSGGSLTYQATNNHDPDGDSNGTTITVGKP